MTTLITGGSGLIGSDVAPRLVERGETVVIYDVTPPTDPPDGVQFTNGDVTDRDALATAVEAYDVDRILHLAAIIGGATNDRPSATTDVNVVGTDNAFAVACEADIDRVAWASTLSVTDPGTTTPTTRC